jgi:hypothetical protein
MPMRENESVIISERSSFAARGENLKAGGPSCRVFKGYWHLPNHSPTNAGK